ncbi:MAG: acetylglutamate kinase [Bacteroidia bacterium]|jgi:acetylglutamate kinase|nr:acetylglutamate kinase [Bacteroidia bacterium]MCC6768303.1 acetylglutamate kinase [Bacteroidia bacterium]
MTLHIIKIGGNIIDQSDALTAFLKQIAQLNQPFILVHGGGKIATSISTRLGITTQMSGGRRITNQDTLQVVTMVYAGLINKQIVAQLQGFNCNAIGLCGADANLIHSQKRIHPEIDFGFVGDPQKVNTKVIQQLITAGLNPVIAPVTHDHQGQLLNTNADTIASFIAIAMVQFFKVRLHFCFEKAGVLLDVNNNESLITHINKHDYENLKNEGKIVDGMLPKLDNAFAAINAGVEEVSILHALQLVSFISNNENTGTRIVA